MLRPVRPSRLPPRALQRASRPGWAYKRAYTSNSSLFSRNWQPGDDGGSNSSSARAGGPAGGRSAGAWRVTEGACSAGFACSFAHVPRSEGAGTVTWAATDPPSARRTRAVTDIDRWFITGPLSVRRLAKALSLTGRSASSPLGVSGRSFTTYLDRTATGRRTYTPMTGRQRQFGAAGDAGQPCTPSSEAE